MIQIGWKKYKLLFRFEAGTSRGILTEKDSYFVIINSKDGLSGIGECGPLPGLSPDYLPDFEDKLTAICRKLTNIDQPDKNSLDQYIRKKIPDNLPSIKMGFEMAWLDLFNGGKREIFSNNFFTGRRIPINGLIWMGEKDFMLEQVSKKIAEKYSCIKIKIGALDLDRELEVLKFIRDQPEGSRISIRVDANGAFKPDNVYPVLEKLAIYNIHSIEQPLKPGQWHNMAELCKNSPIPVALDEELIGILEAEDKQALLEKIQPQYLVLKPTLLGGFTETSEWIDMSSERGIGWWITSALESNLGLNAIAQFTAGYDPEMEQGLGTGQLYKNNFISPLVVENGTLRYDPSRKWDLDALHMDHL